MKKTILLTLLIISSGHTVNAQCKPFNPITYDKNGMVKNMTKPQCQDLFRRKPHCRAEKIKELNAILRDHGRQDIVNEVNFDGWYWDSCVTVSAETFDYPILYDGEDQYGNNGNICIAAQPRKPYRGETVQVFAIANTKKPIGSNACGNTAKNPRTARVFRKSPAPQITQTQSMERVQTNSSVPKAQPEIVAAELPRVVTGQVKTPQPSQSIDVLSEELPRVVTNTTGNAKTAVASSTESYSVPIPKSSPEAQMSQTEHVPSEYTPQKHDVEEVSEPIEKEITQKVIIHVKPVYEYVYDEPILTTRNKPTSCKTSSRCKPKVRSVSISNGQSICISDKCGRKTEVIVN